MNTEDKISKLLNEDAALTGQDTMGFTAGLVQLKKILQRATQNNNKIQAQQAFELANRLVADKPIYWRKVLDVFKSQNDNTVQLQ